MRWSSGSVPPARDALRLAGGLAAALALTAGVPAAADLAFVTCQNGDALSVVDTAARAEIARWDVPGKPAGVAAGPGAVYTVSPDDKTVRRWSLSGALGAARALDGGPIGIALDAGRGRVFVSDWYNARAWVLDADTLALTGELTTRAAPSGLALSADGAWLAIAERDADRVSIFDAQTLARVHAVAVGSRPFGLGFAPDGRLFVGNVGSNDVTVIDPASGEVIATVPVQDHPYGVAFAAGRAFVTNQYAGTLSVISLDDLSTVATLPAGEYPEGIAATSDGQIAVANWFDNTLHLIDAASLQTVAQIDTADGPRAFGAFVLDTGR